MGRDITPQNLLVHHSWSIGCKIKKSDGCAIGSLSRGLTPNTETCSWCSAKWECNSTCRWSSETGCPEDSKGCRWTRYPVTLPVAGIHSATASRMPPLPITTFSKERAMLLMKSLTSRELSFPASCDCPTRNKIFDLDAPVPPEGLGGKATAVLDSDFRMGGNCSTASQGNHNHITTRKSQQTFNKMEKTIHQPSQNHPPLGATQGSADSFSQKTCIFGPDLENMLKIPLAVVESDEVSPQPPFLQAEQPQVPQPLPISLVLQTLPQLRCPSLDTLQPLNVSLGVRGPKLNTGFEVRPHQCRVQGHDHCPSPAGHTISDTSQDAIGFLGHLGTLLAHIQAAVNKHPQVLFHQAAFQPLFPKPVALHGVVVTQVQDLALSLVEPHTIDLGPSIQPVQVPLQSLPTLQQINTPTQLGVICKLTAGALDPLVQIIDKDIKHKRPQN
ncbi:hypothetical protein QYF61_020355 [Mycteria americana]|uniref:Uncharacterized protein n=1 Tax=Mycteria americana TaxID=33587 RepID=A0AAN7NUP1_MYCAM|nr:hypothetical protein QYF61_020355 [Mycteria americana]